jgi:hypothetical protein
MGVWAAGTGVPEVWGAGGDEEAGGAGAVDVLVPGVSALGCGGRADGRGAGGAEGEVAGEAAGKLLKTAGRAPVKWNELA